MTNENDVKKIAEMLTDDPDIFNEMALGTGAIAMPPGGNIKRSKKQRAAEDDDVEGIKKYFADPVTGQAKGKTKSGKKKKAGEVLFAGVQDEEPEDSIDESKQFWVAPHKPGRGTAPLNIDWAKQRGSMFKASTAEEAIKMAYKKFPHSGSVFGAVEVGKERSTPITRPRRGRGAKTDPEEGIPYNVQQFIHGEGFLLPKHKKALQEIMRDVPRDVRRKYSLDEIYREPLYQHMSYLRKSPFLRAFPEKGKALQDLISQVIASRKSLLDKYGRV